jgi:hypothetical protein
MSYSEIFILGWNLNGMVFVLNLFVAMRIMKSTDIVTMTKEQERLSELKEELDNYYPNRSWETLISYFVPFTAFFRVSWRFYEMKMFFTKNEGTKLYDFMVYRYQKDIQMAKNR